MVWLRRGTLCLLSLLLFVSLLVGAFAASSNSVITKPKKIEQWLNQSNLYGSFVNNAIEQAQKSAGNDQSGAVSLTDTAVKQAAQSAFSSQLLQENVNTFLDSHYDWLEGRTSKPSFSIDLSSAKQSFAERVGRYVKTYLTGLPTCSDAQLAQIPNAQTADPLTLSCRPANLDPSVASAQVTQQISTNGNFLSNSVITPNSINPEGNSQNKPYYQKFSKAPQVYQLSVKLPWISAIAAVLSVLGVVFLAARRRTGVRLVGIILLLAGFVLIATKFVADQAFDKLEHRIFNNTDVGQLQKALTTFFHHVENQLVKVDLWFGIAYLVVAILILIILLITRQRAIKSSVAIEEGLGSPTTTGKTSSTDPRDIQLGRSKPTPDSVAGNPPRPKPPRLVQ